MGDELTTEQKLEQLLKKQQEQEARAQEQERKNNELQAQFTAISEENARMKGIISEFGQEPPSRGDRRPSVPDPVTDPQGFADHVQNETMRKQEAENARRSQMEAQAKAIREAFFKKHPHLANHQPLVAYFTNQVLSEFPNIPQETGFEEVAKRCDQYIKDHLGGPSNAPAAPHVGGGGGQPASSAPPAPSDNVQKSQEETTREAIEERKKFQATRAVPPHTLKS